MASRAGEHGRASAPVGGRADDGGTASHVLALLDALHGGALLVDRGGRIVHVNSRLCQMMVSRREELVGRSLLDLYPTGHGRSVVQDVLEHFDESREQEFYLPRPDGTQLPVIVSGRHLEGELPFADHRIVTVIDISPQKRAETELQQRYRDIATLSDTVLEQAMELKRYSRSLEERVAERTAELHKANLEAIYMLAVASEAKDFDTGAHVRRIEHYSRSLAQELGLPGEESERIGYSAILHDVGKILVPDEILRKPAPLSEDEWQIMRQHPIAGERILSREPFFDLARGIARSHHENWDGSGYPDGLAGAAIPLAARIVHVADVYDALTTERPYKQAWSPAEAASAVERQQGRLFDPDVARAFLRLVP